MRHLVWVTLLTAFLFHTLTLVHAAVATTCQGVVAIQHVRSP